MAHTCEEPEAALEAAEVLKAIAHPVRLRIVAILCDEQLHVNALAERLDVPQSIVSQQLRILRMRNLVNVTRQNGHAYYRLTQPHLKQMVQCMDSCLLDRGGNPS
jgi:ArsR family transcriptional regulator